MSVAKVTEVKAARKAQGACEKCRVVINAGDPYRWFKVGFRARFKHVRCMKPECTPRISERESSLLADVYAAQEAFDVSGYSTLAEIMDDVNGVAKAIREVAEQYREAGTNEHGVEWNSENIERADTLDQAADELEQWEYNGETNDDDEPLDMDDAMEQATEAVNNVETP